MPPSLPPFFWGEGGWRQVNRLDDILLVLVQVDFAMQMYDILGTGKLRQDEIIKLLSAINRTASYFGDPCLTEQQVPPPPADPPPRRQPSRGRSGQRQGRAAAGAGG